MYEFDIIESEILKLFKRENDAINILLMRLIRANPCNYTLGLIHTIFTMLLDENVTFNFVVEASLTIASFGAKKSVSKEKRKSNYMMIISKLLEIEDPSLNIVLDLLEAHTDSLEIDTRIT